MATSAGSTKYWWLKDGNIGLGWLVEDSEGDTVLKAIAEIKTVKVHYIRRPADFSTTLTTQSQLPSQLHEALATRVIEKLYARFGELDKARYWRAEWKDYISDGIRHNNKMKDGTSFNVRQYNY